MGYSTVVFLPLGWLPAHEAEVSGARNRSREVREWAGRCTSISVAALGKLISFAVTCGAPDLNGPREWKEKGE